MNLLGVFHHVVPGGRRLLGIETGPLEHVRVPDKRHRLVVRRDAVGLALPHVRLHGPGPEILGGVAYVLGLQLLEIPLGGEFDAAQDLQPHHHGSGVAKQCRPELVEEIVVGVRLLLKLNVGIGFPEGCEEVLVILAQEIGVSLEHALIPEREAPLVVERRDLAALGCGVEILCARNRAHIFRRPFAQVDGGRGQYGRRHQKRRENSRGNTADEWRGRSQRSTLGPSNSSEPAHTGTVASTLVWSSS